MQCSTIADAALRSQVGHPRSFIRLLEDAEAPPLGSYAPVQVMPSAGIEMWLVVNATEKRMQSNSKSILLQ